MKTRKRKAEADQKLKLRNVFPLYRACMDNAGNLLREAELLLEHQHHSRAFFLAFTSYEEIGKAQLVADYMTACASDSEFDAAFKSHTLKPAYVSRCLVVEKHGRATLEYDESESKELIAARMASLYVRRDAHNGPIAPEAEIDCETANSMIETVKEQIGEILSSEFYEGRIGSKGLFK